MLVPLTREKFEQLIPLIATGPQYKYYWGNFSKFIQRLLISVVIVAIALLIRVVLRLDFGPIKFIVGLIGAFYWLWGPVLQASLQNIKYRRYKYGGFFRGRILDLWLTEELIGKQETVNNKGELVIVENREKRINLEIGDDTGFIAEYQAPLQFDYKAVARGQIAEMLVLSNRADLSRIEEITDLYIPSRNIWISDYPILRRDFFTEVGNQLREDDSDRPRRRRRPSQQDVRRRRRDEWSTEDY
ncbi:MAG: phosphate ABC transporter permease [Calothrix sp. C42_A2020_038]|nr:phosphate ABC transporter permease [Calothrix sp. C42_A2020_038]